MVSEIVGDLLRDGRGIICHQVNTYGIMGAGIALSIRERLLSDAQYKHYRDLCYQRGAELLGSTWFAECDSGPGRRVVVANMFSQRPFSNTSNLTDYEAMRTCFKEIRRRAEEERLPIYIPGRIGCGIAGGDWFRVQRIIWEELDDAPVPVTIVYWSEEAR